VNISRRQNTNTKKIIGILQSKLFFVFYLLLIDWAEVYAHKKQPIAI